jgi:hypothetical protein
LGERAVRYAIQELEESGELVVIRGRGRGNKSQYEINLPMTKKGQDLPLLQSDASAESDAEKGQDLPLLHSDPDAEAEVEKGQVLTEKGANFDSKKQGQENKRGKFRQKKGQISTAKNKAKKIKGANFDRKRGKFLQEKGQISTAYIRKKGP